MVNELREFTVLCAEMTGSFCACMCVELQNCRECNKGVYDKSNVSGGW